MHEAGSVKIIHEILETIVSIRQKRKVALPSKYFCNLRRIKRFILLILSSYLLYHRKTISPKTTFRVWQSLWFLLKKIMACPPLSNQNVLGLLFCFFFFCNFLGPPLLEEREYLPWFLGYFDIYILPRPPQLSPLIKLAPISPKTISLESIQTNNGLQ